MLLLSKLRPGWRWVYPIKNPAVGSLQIQVTDGLPQVGFRTLLWAIVLAFVLSFGLHAILKLLTECTAFDRSRLLDKFPAQVRSVLVAGQKQDNSLATLILESSLHAKVPSLLYQQDKETPLYAKRAPIVKADRVDHFYWLPTQFGTYFSSDVSAVQIYLYFASDCELDDACQRELLKAAYSTVAELKQHPAYIFYRLQSGFIQLVATYLFSIGILVFVLRARRATHIRRHLETGGSGKHYAESNGWPSPLFSLSFKEVLRSYWSKALIIDPKKEAPVPDPQKDTVDDQLIFFNAVYYEPHWTTAVGTSTYVSRASLFKSFHKYLAIALRWDNGYDQMSARDRFSSLLPRTIFKVCTAYAVNHRDSPESACERAGEALGQAVDEIAATMAIDRDLFSRLVELTPVVGFFGTVVGLSLAMLGANDVVRAASNNWNYRIADNVTYITSALQDSSEKQQIALQEMLGALSIKFDTTGWALILMFILIVLGARVQRREFRTLSFVHSAVSDSLLSVLPTIGSGLSLPPAPTAGAPTSSAHQISERQLPARQVDPVEPKAETFVESHIDEPALAP
jgi:hypothetical protein